MDYRQNNYLTMQSFTSTYFLFLLQGTDSGSDEIDEGVTNDSFNNLHIPPQQPKGQGMTLADTT